MRADSAHSITRCSNYQGRELTILKAFAIQQFKCYLGAENTFAKVKSSFFKKWGCPETPLDASVQALP